MQVSNRISLEQSYEIKGVAILLMLIHHFFTFPSWIIGGGYTPNLEFAALFNSPTKLCVCIFAFLNGWAFALGNPSIPGALKKIKKLMIGYWWIAIPSMFLAKFVCGYNLSMPKAVMGLFGLDSSVMIFSWYIPFYCVSILLMTIIHKYLDGKQWVSLLVGIIAPILIFTLLKSLPFNAKIQTLFNNLKHWFPCVAVGYISNKNKWIEECDKFSKRMNRYVVAVMIIILCFVGHYFVSGLDFIYCFLLVYSIINLPIRALSIVGKILRLCGIHSTNMWFLHCLYFSEATRIVVQPLVYFVRKPIFIYVLAIIELIVVSKVVDFVKKHSVTVLKSFMQTA